MKCAVFLKKKVFLPFVIGIFLKGVKLMYTSFHVCTFSKVSPV